MSDEAEKPVDDPRAEAANWDVRLRAADCSDEDRAAFEVWYAAYPDNAEAYDKVQSLLALLRSSKDEPQAHSLVEAALSRAETRKRRSRFALVSSFAGVAAAGAIGLFVLGTLNTNDNTAPGVTLAEAGPETPVNVRTADQPERTLAMHRPPFYATVPGERKDVALADGSIATLNTASLIRTDFSETARDIELLSGQASFDVEKDPNRPFTVIAGDRRITAIGTVFDVRLDAGEVEVILIEGEVDVVQTGDTANARIDPIRMVAGERYLAPIGAAMTSVAQVDLDRETLWHEGRVFFEDTPLSEALTELSRYSDTEFVTTDPALDGFLINGMFRTDDPMRFIEDIEAFFPVVIDRSTPDELVVTVAD